MKKAWLLGALLALQGNAQVTGEAAGDAADRRDIRDAQDLRDMKDLPLFEVPAAGGDARLAVMLSGDGGWSAIDRGVSQYLAKHGVPVVGLSSLRYFWRRKTQAQAAADLARMLTYYLRAWKKSRIVLIGYSLGADNLPAMASGLPGDLLARVSLMALIGAEKTYDLEFHLIEWIPIRHPDPYPVMPELEKLRALRILCVHGSEEAESLCPEVAETFGEAMQLPGRHHFGGHYAVIADAILKASRVGGP